MRVAACRSYSARTLPIWGTYTYFLTVCAHAVADKAVGPAAATARRHTRARDARRDASAATTRARRDEVSRDAVDARRRDDGDARRRRDGAGGKDDRATTTARVDDDGATLERRGRARATRDARGDGDARRARDGAREP